MFFPVHMYAMLVYDIITFSMKFFDKCAIDAWSMRQVYLLQLQNSKNYLKLFPQLPYDIQYIKIKRKTSIYLTKNYFFQNNFSRWIIEFSITGVKYCRYWLKFLQFVPIFTPIKHDSHGLFSNFNGAIRLL